MMNQEEILQMAKMMNKFVNESGIIGIDATFQTGRSDVEKYHVHSRKSDGRICGTIYGSDNKRKFFYGSSEREVIDKIKKYEMNQKVKNEVLTNFVTLNDYIDYWFKKYYRNSVGDTTFDRLEDAFSYQIKSHKIGLISLHLVTTDDLQSFINDKIDSGLSKSSLDKICQILRATFSLAYRLNYIPRNPMEGVIYSKKRINRERERKQLENEEINESAVKTYSSEEIKLLIKCINETWYKKKAHMNSPAFIFQLKTFIRVGELIGLMWSDIDFMQQVVYVRRGIVSAKQRDSNGNYTGRKVTKVNPPKTHAGKRAIPLCQDAIDALLELKSRYDSLGINSKYVVCTLNGTRESERNYNRTIQIICKKARIDYRSSHKFRITGITNLVNNKDMPVTQVQEYAGHTNVRTTLSYVKKINNDYTEIARNALQNI